MLKPNEQLQVVGLLCREIQLFHSLKKFMTLKKHPPLDDVIPSATDAKRMFESYIAVELQGSENKGFRTYARATNTLANEVTHKRTATIKLAILCSSNLCMKFGESD